MSRFFEPRPLAVLIQVAAAAGCFSWQGAAQAADSGSAARAGGMVAASYVEFNGAFLRGNSANAVDVKRFANGNPMMAGSYRSETTLNGDWFGKLDFNLVTHPTRGTVEVCLDRGLLRRLGVDPAKAPAPVRDFLMAPATAPGANAGSACLFASDIDPAARTDFDPSELKLSISVPQSLLSRKARGYVPPEAWDPGVMAVAMDYQLSGYRSNFRNKEGESITTNSAYGGVTLRANLGAGWQFTHMGGLRVSSGADTHYTSTGAYLSHDIPSWMSSVRIGDANTGGQLFDSVAFRGLRLTSDERMLPESLRGFAPVIRGQARGNAVVSIKQNGTLLREIAVPAGPFEIDDLYPPGFGGDLNVTVTEADGSQTTTVVPFAAGPEVLREGQWRHDLSMGQVTGVMFGKSPRFAMGTLQYGFNNYLTGAVGAIAMERYASVLLGGAVNTRLGSLGLTATLSRFDSANRGSLTGASYNMTYSVVIPQVRTNFSFAAYRYNTQHYVSVSEAASSINGLILPTSFKVKNRAVATLNQTLTERSQVYLNASQQSYWGSERDDVSFNLGYSMWFKGLQLSVSAGRASVSTSTDKTTTYAIGLVIPLGGMGTTSTISANYQHNKAFGNNAQVSAGGAFGENYQYGYSVSAIKSDQSSATAAASATWRSNFGSVGASIGKSGSGNQQSLTMSGGVVVHRGGVSFAPSVGETYAVIDAGPAVGARLLSGLNVVVGHNGYAIVPYLSPYQLNNIELDMRNVSLDVDMEATSAQVAPRSGAAVLVKFNGRQGLPALVDLALDQGSIPLGASIVDLQGAPVGVVGQGGVGEVRVKEDRGTLRVSWGDEAGQSCDFDYLIPAKQPGQLFSRTAARCRVAAR